MAWICRHIHNRSLVLIDEFGKGTASQGMNDWMMLTEDGIALFLALLHHIHTYAPSSAYFLLSTHFSEYLQNPNLLPDNGQSIEKKQMKVLFDGSNVMTPLYKVTDGVCQDSLGIQCAICLGLPEEITNRAQQVRIQ